MKLSVSLLLVFSLVMDLVFGCGIKKDNVPQLMYKIADETHANGNDKLALSIFSNGQWSDWMLVYENGCDWKERDETDYFDVPSITDSWDAVALYNCGIDGILIEEIGYWNGNNNDETITYFCDSIGYLGGISCDLDGGDPAEDSFGECYRGDSIGSIYKKFWLDQNDGHCDTVSISTGKTLIGDSTSVAKFYFKSTPGAPTCSQLIQRKEDEPEKELFNIFDSLEQNKKNALSNGWMLFIALFVCFALFGIFKYYKNKKYVTYQPLNGNENESVYGSVNA